MTGWVAHKGNWEEEVLLMFSVRRSPQRKDSVLVIVGEGEESKCNFFIEDIVREILCRTRKD